MEGDAHEYIQVDSEEGQPTGSTRTNGQSPIEEIGDNWNPMDFGNPKGNGSSSWDAVFTHSVHNHQHNMSNVDREDLKKLSFVSGVKGSQWRIKEGILWRRRKSLKGKKLTL